MQDIKENEYLTVRNVVNSTSLADYLLYKLVKK